MLNFKFIYQKNNNFTYIKYYNFLMLFKKYYKVVKFPSHCNVNNVENLSYYHSSKIVFHTILCP